VGRNKRFWQFPANCGSSLLRFIMTSDDHHVTACSAAAVRSYATHVSQRAFDAGLTSLIDGLAAALPDKAVSSPASVNRKRSSTG
jgi:hypothetical protein